MTAAFDPATTPEQNKAQAAAALELEWAADPRWNGIERSYTGEDVVKLRGRVQEEHTLARRGSEKLWDQLRNAEPGGYTNALGALTGNQAVQQVKAGLKAVYLSGWQVAADANSNGNTYPDQSLYPVDSVPKVVRRINNALLRADQIESSEGIQSVEDWLVPIVADAEASFGGPLNAYELMKSMIASGASGRPAGQRKEVRPFGREGPDPHQGTCPHAERRKARGRRRRCPLRHHCPHGR